MQNISAHAIARRSITGLVLLALFAVPSLALAAAADALDSASSQAEASTGGDIWQTARLLVSARHGIPFDALEIGNVGAARYRALGVQATRLKVVDTRDGRTFVVTFNDAGQEVDHDAFVAADAAAHAAQYGRLERDLATRLLTAAPEEVVPVILWLKAPLYQIPRPKLTGTETLGDIEAIHRGLDAQLEAIVTPIVTPIVERLRRMGFSPRREQYSPVVYAELPPSAIRIVNQWVEVDRIYSAPTYHPLLEVARPIIWADRVLANGKPATGKGVKVAQIEVGGRVATNNPALRRVFQDELFVCPSADAFDAHASAVAGVIRSTDRTVKGIAPEVDLWAGGSCTGDPNQLMDRSTAAVNWGARVLNLSFGADTALAVGALERFYDDLVFNRRATVVVAAGNDAAAPGCFGSGTGNVNSPGLAYNVLTVGAFDDLNTVDWTGDVMYPCSSFRDPLSVNGDREKPEVVAPGVRINTTTSQSPWFREQTGTSFAAPMVAGAVALMSQVNAGTPTALFPEGYRAGAVAQAKHNIEGDSRLSELDGGGGITAWIMNGVTDAYSCASTPNPWEFASICCVGVGTRIRAAIAWSTNPNYANYSSQPSVDLDLYMVDGFGRIVGSSVSFDNTYEIVEFIAPVAGEYRFRVVRARCEADTFFAVAAGL